MLAGDKTAVERREQTAGLGDVSIKCYCCMLYGDKVPFHPPFPWPVGLRLCRLCVGILRQMPLACVSAENKDIWWSVAAKQPCKFTFSKATRQTKREKVIPRSCSRSGSLAAINKYYLVKEDLKMNLSSKHTKQSFLVGGEENSTIEKVIGVKITKRIRCLVLTFKAVMASQCS